MTRVVVTGLGMVTPAGSGKDAVWDALLAGRSAVGPVRSFDTSALPVHLGAEIREFDPHHYIRHSDPARLGRSTQLAVAAARMALADAGLEEGIQSPAAGTVIGTSYGEQNMLEQLRLSSSIKGDDALRAGIAGAYPCHVMGARVAAEFALRGPCLTVPGACAAGNYALTYGFDVIRSGRAELMLAGAADAFSRATYIGFARLGVIAPERCQPFDRNRSGMIPGEGSAVLVLESAQSARRRGGRIYAEIRGCGITSDAQHMTAAADAADSGAVRAMCRALKEAGAEASEVNYISAHGTGTYINDRTECAALVRLLGPRAGNVPVSSVKATLGHSMGAASAIEAAVCALTLATGMAPPTINYEEPDPDCPVDCIPDSPRRVDARLVLSNAFAFGGNATSICMGRWDP